MAAREKREIPITPLILKFGVAFAVSLGGVLYTIFRTKRIKTPKSEDRQRCTDCGNQSGSWGGSFGCVDDDDHALKDSSTTKLTVPNSISDLSSRNRYKLDSDFILLSESEEPIEERNLDITMASISHSPSQNLKNYILDEQNQEINTLREQVNILEERERYLEIQLLEYYGLKEQESDVIELQNRLRLNNMESKLYTLKIEALESDNRRLAAQVADYGKVVAELEDAKSKIKVLRKKLRFEAEENREQILALQERVMKMQDYEKKGAESDRDVEIRVREKKEIEEELEEVKKSNHDLKMANSELTKKLENLQMIATSALDEEEAKGLNEENHRLRQQNEDLTKQIEQIQTDRCTDIEELVYLRWINACLRYELRNYQPGPGKTIARDLSKTLSPKSEEKAKKLILEYASKENPGSYLTDFDLDYWSSFHYLTDSGEPDDSSVITLSVNEKNPSSKAKVFAKLMRLIRGKDSSHHLQTPPLHQERDVSVEDILGSRCSGDFHSGQKSMSCNSSRRTSDDGSSSIFRRIDSIKEGVNDLTIGVQPHLEAQEAAKTELVKYAESLKSSSMKSTYRRRSVSFSSL